MDIDIKVLKSAKKGDVLICAGNGKFAFTTKAELFADYDKRLAKCEELKSELNTLRLQIAKALKEI